MKNYLAQNANSAWNKETKDVVSTREDNPA